MKNTLLVCALALSALSFPSFAQEGKEVEWYNVTAVLLKQLTSIAINRKVYTGYKDIGGGLFAVKTGACYSPLDPNAFSPVQTDAQNEYTWGAIDKYCEEYDIIFLQGKEKDGTVRAGARGYDGRVRIPFKYDFRADLGLTDHFCIMSRDKKYGFVDYDGKLDVFDKSFNLVRTENRD